MFNSLNPFFFSVSAPVPCLFFSKYTGINHCPSKIWGSWQSLPDARSVWTTVPDWCLSRCVEFKLGPCKSFHASVKTRRKFVLGSFERDRNLQLVLLLNKMHLIATELLIAVFVWLSFPEATCPEWNELEQAMTSVHSVVNGLVDFSKVGGVVSNKFVHSVMYLTLTMLFKHLKFWLPWNL